MTPYFISAVESLRPAKGNRLVLLHEDSADGKVAGISDAINHTIIRVVVDKHGGQDAPVPAVAPKQKI